MGERISRRDFLTAVLATGAGAAGYLLGRGSVPQQEPLPSRELTVYSPEFYSSIENFLSENFTEILPGKDGFIGTVVAKWGRLHRSFPYSESVNREAFSLDSLRSDSQNEKLRVVLNESHNLQLGLNTVVPTNEYTLEYGGGNVVIQRDDVRMFVRTAGARPVAYGLVPSEFKYGDPGLNGYYLTIDGRPGSINLARITGVTSVDGTPFPVMEGNPSTISYQFVGDQPKYTTEVFVLPK